MKETTDCSSDSNTNLNWVDKSPRFDTLLKTLFAVCIIAAIVAQCCSRNPVFNP